jgi:hypothetical protein
MTTSVAFMRAVNVGGRSVIHWSIITTIVAFVGNLPAD